MVLVLRPAFSFCSRITPRLASSMETRRVPTRSSAAFRPMRSSSSCASSSGTRTSNSSSSWTRARRVAASARERASASRWASLAAVAWESEVRSAARRESLEEVLVIEDGAVNDGGEIGSGDSDWSERRVWRA